MIIARMRPIAISRTSMLFYPFSLSTMRTRQVHSPGIPLQPLMDSQFPDYSL